MEGAPLPTSPTRASTKLTEFQECPASAVRKFIMITPTKSCTLDPIPTFFLNEIVDTLLPFLTTMINMSLLEGHLPGPRKHAIMTPLLKKSDLDVSEMKNYRPVSNLTFVLEIVERIVSEQMKLFEYQ